MFFAGPLLWHFEENITSDPSIELDLEEVKALAAQIGFEIKVSTSRRLRTRFSRRWFYTWIERTHNRYDLCQQQGFNARICISCRLLDGHKKVVDSDFSPRLFLRTSE